MSYCSPKLLRFIIINIMIEKEYQKSLIFFFNYKNFDSVLIVICFYPTLIRRHI